MSSKSVHYLTTLTRLLAFSLYKCEATNAINDLNRGILWSGELRKVADVPQNLRSLNLLILGTLLVERNDVSASIDDLHRSVAINEQSLQCPEPRYRSKCYYNLGRALCHRFGKKGSRGDLEGALISCKQAEDHLTPNDRFLPALNRTLAWLQSSQAQVTNNPAQEEGRNFNPLSSDNNHRFAGFSNLALILDLQFLRPPTIQSLDR